MKGVILRWGFLGALLFSAGLGVSAQEAAKHPITFDDMIKLQPHFGAAGVAGRKVGGVHGGDAGHGSQP